MGKDLKFVKLEDNSYDIQIGPDGDLLQTDGLDTNVIVSFLAERRAESTEVQAVLIPTSASSSSYFQSILITVIILLALGIVIGFAWTIEQKENTEETTSHTLLVVTGLVSSMILFIWILVLYDQHMTR